MHFELPPRASLRSPMTRADRASCSTLHPSRFETPFWARVVQSCAASAEAHPDRARRTVKATNSVGRIPMSWSRMKSLIEQGFGQGRFEAYQAFIKVTRGLSSPNANLGVTQLAIHWRGMNLLSNDEIQMANLAVWLGAVEIREQFPLFPWPFIHPMAGLDPDRDRRLPPSPGLADIAREAGIELGVFVGADQVPYMATTDLVLLIGQPPRDRLVYWSIKPLAKMVVDDPYRTLERMELERRHAVAAGGLHCAIHRSEIGETLLSQIGWLQPMRSEMDGFLNGDRLLDFAYWFDLQTEGQPISECTALAGLRCRMDVKEGHAAFRAAAWLGLIDIDLASPIVMSRPPQRDLVGFKASLQKSLLGVSS